MTTATTAPLDAALFYAGLGWRVVPIVPGTKRPGLEAWQDRATVDPELIGQWWQQWPDHGVGIATGRGSGVFVLDVDVADGKAGDETLNDLERRYGALPVTVEAITGTGGRHLFYRHPPDLELSNSAGRLGPGLDIRADGGQVVAAPTVHPDTGQRYEWELDHHPATTTVAEAPAWLLELLAPPPAIEVGPRGSFDDAVLAWDRFNRAPGATQAAADMLAAAGWQEGRPDRTGARYFTRPGKRHGIGATVGRVAPGVVYCFTSSAPPLEAERTYDPADLLALLVHGGDRAAADRQLVEAGWGIPSHATTPADVEAYVERAGAANVAPGTAGGLWLPEELWQARPVLAHVRQAARSRLVAPDAVLGAVLARVAALTPHTVELPPIVGAPCGLTFYAGLVGPPESGKSTAAAVAAEIMPAPPAVLDRLPIGSGEGFVDVLFEMVTEEGDDGKKRTTKQQTKHAAIFHVDEGTVLGDLGQRTGSTIMPTLRTAFTHGTLGQVNASAERKRVLPGHLYVYGVTLGIQPELAGPMLADAAAGTPQRFVWLTSTDPGAHEQQVPWPGPLPWAPVSTATLEAVALARGGGWRRHPIEVPDAIRAEIRADRVAAVQGTADRDQGDAHRMLVRLKVAALFGLLDGRLGIDHDDWHLAELVVDTSRRVRHHVERILALTARNAERVSTDRVVRRELAIEDSREQRALTAAARSIGKLCHRHAAAEAHAAQGGGCTRKCWLTAARRYRDIVDDAVGEAERLDWIVGTGERWTPGGSAPA